MAASAARTRPLASECFSKASPSTADLSVLHHLIYFTCGLCTAVTASGVVSEPHPGFAACDSPTDGKMLDIAL